MRTNDILGGAKKILSSGWTGAWVCAPLLWHLTTPLLKRFKHSQWLRQNSCLVQMHIDSFRLIIYPQKQKSFHHRKQPIKFSYHRWKQLTETVFPNCAHSWIEQCDLNTSSLTVNRNFQTEGTSWYFVCLIFRASNFLFSYQANSNTFQNLRKIDKKKTSFRNQHRSSIFHLPTCLNVSHTPVTTVLAWKIHLCLVISAF